MHHGRARGGGRREEARAAARAAAQRWARTRARIWVRASKLQGAGLRGAGEHPAQRALCVHGGGQRTGALPCACMHASAPCTDLAVVRQDGVAICQRAADRRVLWVQLLVCVRVDEACVLGVQATPLAERADHHRHGRVYVVAEDGERLVPVLPVREVELEEAQLAGRLLRGRIAVLPVLPASRFVAVAKQLVAVLQTCAGRRRVQVQSNAAVVQI